MTPAHNRQYFSLGNDLQGAMNEGQADYIAYNTSGNIHLASWFAYVLTNGKRKILRSINNTYKFNQNVFREIHDDGMIFAGALFDLGQKIGVDETLNLWLASIPLITEMDGYQDFAQHILHNDTLIFNGKYQQSILDVFTARGILNNSPVQPRDLQVFLKISDDPITTNIINFAIFQEYQIQMPNGQMPPNQNDVLDPGECAAVELLVQNKSDTPAVGVELFMPNVKLPFGVNSEAANRFYIGVIQPHEKPADKINLYDLARPWIYLCADQWKYNRGGKIQVILKSASTQEPIIYDLPLVTAPEATHANSYIW